jgi:elongation factor 2
MWGWGPNERGPNALFDMVLDTGRYCYPYRHEVKSAVVSGFNFATQEGVLCGEPVRGVRFNLVDTTLHPDARRRGAGQIIPTARRGVWAALMTAQPRLMEPVYLIEARANEANIDAACALIAQRRGQVLSPHPDRRTNVNDSTGGLTTDHNEPKHAIVAYLPVAESLGFWAALREATGANATQSITVAVGPPLQHVCADACVCGVPCLCGVWSEGGANVQFVFDHWQLVEGDPRDPSSRAGQLVLNVRRRKGLKEEIPSFDDLADKL